MVLRIMPFTLNERREFVRARLAYRGMESGKGTDKRRWREIGYGLRDGALVHIADVESGLACQCVCAACGERLVARKGRKRRHHFAHHVHTGCDGGSETVLHRLAKEIFLSLPYMIVPSYDFQRVKHFRYGKSVSHAERLAAGGTVPIESVRLEATYPGVRPDIEIESHGKRLFIEIEVSNRVNQLKRRRLRTIDVPTIAIVLMEEDAMLSREALTDLLRDDVFSKQWVYHPKEKAALAAFYAKYRANPNRYPRRVTIERKSARVAAKRPPSSWPSVAVTDGHKPYGKCGERYFAQFGRYPTLEQAMDFCPEYFGIKKR